MKELIEADADPEEFEAQIEVAEKQLEADQKAKSEQKRKSKIRRTF